MAVSEKLGGECRLGAPIVTTGIVGIAEAPAVVGHRLKERWQRGPVLMMASLNLAPLRRLHGHAIKS